MTKDFLFPFQEKVHLRVAKKNSTIPICSPVAFYTWGSAYHGFRYKGNLKPGKNTT